MSVKPVNYFFGALALFLLAPTAPAQGASFDCAQVGTEIEHKICGDAELSALDELLGDRYVRALKKGEDPKAIKAAQRAWLRDVRNACADAACLKAAYEARIADLTKIGWMTDDKARAVCEEVAAVVNAGRLAKRSMAVDRPAPEQHEIWKRSSGSSSLINTFGVDYDYDGKTETLGTANDGGMPPTCHVHAIHDIEIGRSRSYLNEGPAEFALGEYFLTDLSEPVILRRDFTFAAVAPPMTLLWLAPTGAKFPICHLHAPTTRLTERKSEDPDLCTAVMAGAVEPVRWSARPEAETHEDIENTGAGIETAAYGAELDIDLDGSAETVALRKKFDDRGRSCFNRYLDQPFIALHRTAFEFGSLNRRLSDGSDLERTYPPALFVFREKPYVVGRLRYNHLMAERIPDANPMEVVSSFWNGERRDWCEFEVGGRYEVGKQIPEETWTPAEKWGAGLNLGTSQQ